MKLDFKKLTEVNKSDIIELMNHPLVQRYMPLTSEHFDETSCDELIASKEKLWKERGLGPWAFIIDGKFAGWGGLQPEHEDVEIAIVLHPNFWGFGRLIYTKIIGKAFYEMKLQSVIILFPPSRTRVKGLLKLGFKRDGKVEIEGKQFFRFRLYNPDV